MNSPGGRPSAQWIMKSSRPGHFASIDLMPSMICAGGRHPDFERQVLRPRHHRDLREVVAAIGDRRRGFVKLALVVEGFLVEAFEDQLKLLFEQLAVGGGVEQWRAKALDLAGVVAAP